MNDSDSDNGETTGFFAGGGGFEVELDFFKDDGPAC